MGSKRYWERVIGKGTQVGYKRYWESSIIPLDLLGKGNPGGFQEVYIYWERVSLFH